MRVVLDSNVLLSGFIFGQSAPGQVLAAWYQRRYDLVVSVAILAEVERAFHSSYFQRRLAPEQITADVALLRRQAIVVLLTRQVAGVATHPEDDVILSTAVSGGVDYLVTGDRRLREVGSIEGIAILSPREFLDLLTGEHSPSS